jgi:hypothetical protein
VICEECHGERGWMEFRGARFYRGDRPPARAFWCPCPECGGCGVTHCCDGPVGRIYDFRTPGNIPGNRITGVSIQRFDTLPGVPITDRRK